MSLDASKRPGRRGSNPDLWPKWMWIAVPVLAVVVVAALWWAVFSEPEAVEPTPTPTPTMKVIPTQPSEKPTPQQTVVSVEKTAVILPPPATLTPTIPPVSTPEAPVVTEQEGGAPAVGTTLKIQGTGGAGLNLRIRPGTKEPRVKTLPEGTEVQVIGEPAEGEGYTWYNVRDSAGSEGWGVSTYLVTQ